MVGFAFSNVQNENEKEIFSPLPISFSHTCFCSLSPPALCSCLATDCHPFLLWPLGVLKVPHSD